MSRRARGKTRVEPADRAPEIEPGERCKSGSHLRTPENTGVANTGRRFCRTCKYERAKTRGVKRPSRAKATVPVLSVFEIERILSTLPCMCCGVVPTRRGVGKDGTPRWLDAPVTAHGLGCTVGARREIVQRNRGKGKEVAA